MSNYPRMTYNGISVARQNVLAPKQSIVPSTLTPLFLIISNQGTYKETLVNSFILAKEIYGNEPFDRSSAFFNHQSATLLQVLERGGSAVIKRLDIGGSVAFGELHLVDEDGVAVYYTNTPTVGATGPSLRLLNIEALDVGSGTNIEFEFIHPMDEGGISQDLIDLFIEDHSFPALVKIYRLTKTTRTLMDEVLVSLGTSIPEYNIVNRLSPKFGLPVKVTFDQSILTQAQDFIHSIVFNNDPGVDKNKLDVLFGRDIFGEEQYSFAPLSLDPVLVKVKDGQDNLPLSVSNSVDKLQTLKLFDDTAALYLQETGPKLQNRLLYPFRSFWDTGFTLATKRQIKHLKSSRPELVLVIADYSVAELVDDGTTTIDPQTPISCDGGTSASNGTVFFCNAEMFVNGVFESEGDPYAIAYDYGNVSIDSPPDIDESPTGATYVLDLEEEDSSRTYDIWFNGLRVYSGIVEGLDIDASMVAQYRIYETGGQLFIEPPLEDSPNPFSLFIVPQFTDAVGCLPDAIITQRFTTRYENGTIGIAYGHLRSFPSWSKPNPQASVLSITQFLSTPLEGGGIPTNPFGIFLNLEGINQQITASAEPTFIVDPSTGIDFEDIANQINDWASGGGRPVNAYVSQPAGQLVIQNLGNQFPLTFGTLNAQYSLAPRDSYGIEASQAYIREEGVIDTDDFGLNTYFMSTPVSAYASDYGKHFTFRNRGSDNTRLRFIPQAITPPSEFQRIDWVIWNGDPPNPNLSQAYDLESPNLDTIVCILPQSQR